MFEGRVEMAGRTETFVEIGVPSLGLNSGKVVGCWGWGGVTVIRGGE